MPMTKTSKNERKGAKTRKTWFNDKETKHTTNSSLLERSSSRDLCLIYRHGRYGIDLTRPSTAEQSKGWVRVCHVLNIKLHEEFWLNIYSSVSLPCTINLSSIRITMKIITTFGRWWKGRWNGANSSHSGLAFALVEFSCPSYLPKG